MKIRRVVFASSGGAIYGDQNSFPVSECATPNPVSPYALSKQAFENYVRYFSRTAGEECIILRLANVYGPRQDPGRGGRGRNLPGQDERRGLAPAVYGDGSHTRDYVWVGDVARRLSPA